MRCEVVLLMPWPDDVKCPACKGPMLAHCPDNARCHWLRCADLKGCATIADHRGNTWTPTKIERPA